MKLIESIFNVFMARISAVVLGNTYIDEHSKVQQFFWKNKYVGQNAYNYWGTFECESISK